MQTRPVADLSPATPLPSAQNGSFVPGQRRYCEYSRRSSLVGIESRLGGLVVLTIGILALSA